MSKRLGKVPEEVVARKSYIINTSLGSLHLASNWLNDPSAFEIADVLLKNCVLTNIELASNRIGDAGAKAIGGYSQKSTFSGVAAADLEQG
jgi:hypothetical protein